MQKLVNVINESGCFAARISDGKVIVDDGYGAIANIQMGEFNIFLVETMGSIDVDVIKVLTSVIDDYRESLKPDWNDIIYQINAIEDFSAEKIEEPESGDGKVVVIYEYGCIREEFELNWYENSGFDIIVKDDESVSFNTLMKLKNILA